MGKHGCAHKSHPNCVRANLNLEWGTQEVHCNTACRFNYGPEGNGWFTLTNNLSQRYTGQVSLKQTPGDHPPFSVTANKVLMYACLDCVIYKADAQALYWLTNTATPSMLSTWSSDI